MSKIGYKITASSLEEFSKLSELADSLPKEIRENIQHVYLQSGSINCIELKQLYGSSVEIILPSNFRCSKDDGTSIVFYMGEKNSFGGFDTKYKLIYKRSTSSQTINIFLL